MDRSVGVLALENQDLGMATRTNLKSLTVFHNKRLPLLYGEFSEYNEDKG